ncbi:MAG: hypothetical protein J6I31_04875 [Prevotella sp.]|nr:hypothetical protein [Prevotella sp.]
MKKQLLFFYMTLAFFLTACSNSDDDMIVQESPVTTDVEAFFARALNEKEFLNKPNGFFSLDEFSSLSNEHPVIIRSINSREELEQAYQGELALPEIDFSKITLIIGLTNSRSSAETLGYTRLLENHGNYDFQVVIYKDVNPTGVWSLCIEPILFWKAYPKFPTSRLTATRIIKEVIRN